MHTATHKVGHGCQPIANQRATDEVLRERGEKLRKSLIREGTIQPESRKEEMMAVDWIEGGYVKNIAEETRIRSDAVLATIDPSWSE